MTENQFDQILLELFGCSRDGDTTERLNAWRKKYIKEFGIRNLESVEKLNLMNKTEDYLDWTKKRMHVKLGEALGKSNYLVEDDRILNDKHRPEMRQIEYKAYVLGVDDENT